MWPLQAPMASFVAYTKPEVAGTLTAGKNYQYTIALVDDNGVFTKHSASYSAEATEGKALALAGTIQSAPIGLMVWRKKEGNVLTEPEAYALIPWSSTEVLLFDTGANIANVAWVKTGVPMPETVAGSTTQTADYATYPTGNIMPVSREVGTNIAIGSTLPKLEAAGKYNVSLGALTHNAVTTGGYNNALGYEVQTALTTGNANNAVGNEAQKAIIGGSYNNAVGHQAQRALTKGTNNDALGCAAHHSLTEGNYNVAIGNEAQAALTKGSNNVAVGNEAGKSATTANGCVFLGNKAGKAETGSNKLYIANTETTTPLLLGDFSAATLQINGKWACNGSTPQGKQEGGSLEKVEKALQACGILA